MELLQRLDTWAALITFVALAWYLGIGPMLDHIREALQRVNHYEEMPAQSTSDYVTTARSSASVKPMSALDTDTDTDIDTPADTLASHNAQGETLYRITAEQLQKIRDDERLRGVGEALGTLKGMGLLREVERAQRLTEVKNALVGTSREKQKRLNRLIDAKAGEVEPSDERELLGINDEGGRRLVER